ncbi:Spectrin beta chain, non-erythrocytic 5, partial [Tyrophagus putrescentiae]
FCDVLETKDWIDEKQAAMENERHFVTTSLDQQNIEAKMKKLQKHQTFEAEIQAKAGHLIKKNHPSSIEICSQQDTLFRKCDRLVAWIRWKRAMLQFNETGEDFEHCQSLLCKLDDVGTDMKVDKNRILHLNNLANKLIHQCSANEFFSEETVSGQRNSLNEN